MMTGLKNVGAITAALICCGSGFRGIASDYIWFEGEQPDRTNLEAAQPETDKGRDVLSEGQWIQAHPGWAETPWLEYEITIDRKGVYDLYARKFWRHGPYRWRFDDQPWQSVGKDVALLDSEIIRTHVPANWTHAGRAELTPGRHRLRIEITDPQSPAYFDCFLVTDRMFFPRGKYKPDQPYPSAEEGWFNWNQYRTVFAQSPIDLRSLNEPVAGMNGFIQRRGDRFVQAGKPIRFMAANVGPAVLDMPRHMIDAHARFLARKGINLVRLHGAICVRDGPNADAIDEKNLDQLFYYTAALKREGIFSHLSIYFQHWFDPSELDAIPGYEPDQKPFAIHFYNKTWQAMYREWWKAILTRQNPYIGRPLKDDPCIMGAELLNEDSFFFWTFSYKNIPEPQIRPLETMFGDWLARKYGSLGKAFDTWNTPHERDAVEDGRAGFTEIWQWFGRRNARDRDTVRFLAEVQRRFFDEHYRYLREQCGFKGVICASNWRTANTRFLGAIDKWTNAGCDFFDHHGYFAPWQKKVTPGFGFGPGDLFADRALTRWDKGAPEKRHQALELPFMCATLDNKPTMISEYAWPNFNRWRGEMPLLTTALAGQAGIDALVAFTLAPTPAWQGAMDQHHWPLMSPCELGQYPAAALSYRGHHVKESRPVVHLNIPVDPMLDLKGTEFTDPSSGDYNRASEGRDTSEQGIDIRYFAVGKVKVDFTDDEKAFEKNDLFEYMHRVETNTLDGANDQIYWHYGKGLFMVNSPKSQAVCGFLDQLGRVEMPGFYVQSSLPFATVWLVSLDDRPWWESKKMLLQVMSEERNMGYRTEGEGRKTIRALGGPPIQLREIEGTFKLLRGDAKHIAVTALDINGAPEERIGTADALTFRPRTVYYLLEKN